MPPKMSKENEPPKVLPTRTGLRSAGKGGKRAALAAEPTQPAAPTQTKSGKRKRAGGKSNEHATDNKPEDSLGNQRQTLLERLTNAEKAASIEGFEDTLREWGEVKHGIVMPTNSSYLIKSIDEKVGGADKFKVEERWRKHKERREATALYEDFLYFQTPERRKKYQEHIDSATRNKKRKAQKPFRVGQRPALLWCDIGHEVRLRPILESFEQERVGMIEEVDYEAMGPDELHVRVPATRRTRVGLGQPDPPVDLPAIELHVNREAIEAKRKYIEDTNEMRGVEGSHSERRAREVESLARLPTNLYVNNIVPTAGNWRPGRTRLETGVFLSAGETSRDWITSFDHLDLVKPGVIPVEPHLFAGPSIKNTNSENIMGDETRDMLGENTTRAEERQQSDGVDGLLNEFCEPKRPHKSFRLVETTAWSEATYGRREREHAYMDVRPPSPVVSPPHSPIYPQKTAEHTIHIPADVPRESARFGEYRKKFKDQYGVNYRDFPHFRDAQPGHGYKIAYEPLDIAALPENLQAKCLTGEEPLLDENGCFRLPAPEGTSMRLLREALQQPYQPPRRCSQSSNNVDDDESEDEGDLFRQSYLEGSQVENRGNDEKEEAVISAAAGRLQR